MIIKEPDSLHSPSRTEKAGKSAELQMAFYLRRAFGPQRTDVHIFNDLRIEHRGEFAQMDHLVLHRHGLMIIESKSLRGTIYIHRSGQFERAPARGPREGMPSPVLQARRQAALLRELLDAHKDSLRNRKLLGLVQGGFRSCPIEILVALSDGTLVRGTQHAPEVRKADQIAEAVEARVQAHRYGASFLGAIRQPESDDGTYVLTEDELHRVSSFLVAQHRPAGRAEPTHHGTTASPPTLPPLRTSALPSSPSAVPGLPRAQSTQARPIAAGSECKVCKSTRLHVSRGRFGPYFKCRACNANTRIDLTLPGCTQPASLRADGPAIYLVHPQTRAETLFYVNDG